MDILCSINPEYSVHVRTEGGGEVLYLRIRKAIYGMIESALLWYDLFVSVLKDMGFVLNPYDMCVAKKTINVKQCTVAWYVDNNKISHVEQEVVDGMVAKIGKRFPGLTISTVTEHTFLGIRIKYLDNGTVSLNMIDYIQEVVDDFGKDFLQMVLTPAARWLFAVSDARKLNGEQVETFSLLVAKFFMGLSMRADGLFTCRGFPVYTREESGHRRLEKVETTHQFPTSDD